MKGVIICGFFGLILLATKHTGVEPKMDIRSVQAMVSNGKMTMKKNEYDRLLSRVVTMVKQNTDTLRTIKHNR